MTGRQKAHGFTLVELMVVVAISSVLVAAIAVSMRDLVRTNASRQLVTEVQGEGRAGIGRMQEEIREASLGSRSGAVIAFTAAGIQPRPAVQIFDNVPGGTAWLDVKPGTDAILVVSASFRVFDGAEMAPIEASVNAANFDPVGTPLSVTDVAGFLPGQYVLVGPYKSAGWFQIRAVAGAAGGPGLLTLAAGANAFPEGRADVGAMVRVATARLYHVNLNDELVVRELAVPHAPRAAGEVGGGEVIARGIENLQIDCEVDGGGMGWFQGCPAVVAGGDLQAESVASGLSNPRFDSLTVATLRTVALNAVIRGRNPLIDHTGEPPIAVGNQPALLPSGAADPNAQFARRSYRSVVGVRNTSLGNL